MAIGRFGHPESGHPDGQPIMTQSAEYIMNKSQYTDYNSSGKDDITELAGQQILCSQTGDEEPCLCGTGWTGFQT